MARSLIGPPSETILQPQLQYAPTFISNKFLFMKVVPFRLPLTPGTEELFAREFSSVVLPPAFGWLNTSKASALNSTC